jgi:hypothetical protein
MSQGQQPQVQLLLPDRGAGLPRSIPFRRDTVVRVQDQPPLLGTPNALDFAITGNSAQNGEAFVVGNAQLQASGTVTIRGIRQTQPGSSGNLRLVARLGGLERANSGGFSVCAHPCAVYNGTHCISYFIDPASQALGKVGMEVRIVIDSDSGIPADLDRVVEREVVSETHSRSASMNGQPIWNVQVQKVLQPVAHVDLDWHLVNIFSLRGMLQAHLQGRHGDWSQDQFDEFRCGRCGMQVAAVIPNSGYRITRLVEFDAANVLWLTVRKLGQACTIAGRTSQTGPTGLLEVRMRVPPGGVAAGGFPFP